jgi:CheY-like chemotaxis protein
MEKVTVLVVEDDPVCSMLAQKVLKLIGLDKQLYTANNGREALEIFNRCFCGEIGLPDLILLDLNMPIMDGFQFIQAYEKLQFPHKEKVLIVITTCSVDDHDIERAKELGIKYYLEKPISELVLKSIIAQELGFQLPKVA